MEIIVNGKTVKLNNIHASGFSKSRSGLFTVSISFDCNETPSSYERECIETSIVRLMRENGSLSNSVEIVRNTLWDAENLLCENCKHSEISDNVLSCFAGKSTGHRRFCFENKYKQEVRDDD